MLKFALFFIFTNLIQIEEKTRVLFSRMEHFPDIPFLMTDTKIKEQVSFES